MEHSSTYALMLDHVMQGLEFDDVFLLDFFADSPATAEWRVLLSYLEELSLDETSDVKVSLCPVYALWAMPNSEQPATIINGFQQQMGFHITISEAQSMTRCMYDLSASYIIEI